MTHLATSRLLTLALLADAAGTGAAGLLLSAGGAALAPLLGIPSLVLVSAGLFFLPYAAVVGWLGRRATVPAAAVKTVIGLNLAWGIESLASLALGWLTPGALGIAFVIAQATFVFAMAGAQIAGLRRSGRVAVA